MKGSRRLIVVLAFLLVVAVASMVLAAQAKAGTGVGFAMLKVLAESGGGDATSVAFAGMSGPGMSCDATGGSCAGHEGSSCSMGKTEAKSADGTTCSMAKTGPAADAKTVCESSPAESCSAEKGEDCSTCDEGATCPMHQSKDTTAAPDAK